MMTVRIEMIMRREDDTVIRTKEGTAQTEVVHHTGVDAVFTDGPEVKLMKEERDGVLYPSARYSTNRILRMEVTD